MKKYIIGNWKMNLTVTESSSYATSLLYDLPAYPDVVTIICPGFLALSSVADVIRDHGIGLGAQNCYWRDSGAFTGEVAAAQLRDLVQYVIIGHSERRHVFNEDDRDIRFKVQAALRNKLKPILCVGETEDERSSGDTEHVLEDQVASGLLNVPSDMIDKIIVAYEPVWAIGSNASATDSDIVSAINTVKEQIQHMFGDKARLVPVLYGGSANATNGGHIMALAGVDGLLLGRASLDANEFHKLISLAGELTTKEQG